MIDISNFSAFGTATSIDLPRTFAAKTRASVTEQPSLYSVLRVLIALTLPFPVA
jgi:hypothetical protein